MANKIILVTGGQRSGKSEFAEKLALSLSKRPTYIATAKVMDEDFRQRVEIHKQRRQKNWTNIEEERILSNHDVSNSVILIDCVTLWATNIFFHENEDIKKAENALKEEFVKFTSSSQNAVFIFVTNEIGLGGVSENALQRHFTDLQGRVNQFVASHADDVYFIVSGIPVKIK